MIENTPAREFATEIVRRLRDAGFEALWAGGCVRDELLGRQPKDYDVATSARPEQVRKIFGHRRTIPVGAAFGVITVLGPKPAGPIEVATFRTDGKYADGRRPETVQYTSAEHDAQRRDFTINGLFRDPLTDKVVDYVNGLADLQAGIVRAIGDPAARFAEDKLRLLRAVRFATQFDFALDPRTAESIRQQAASLQVVSGERIGNEMQKMLSHPNRRQAIELAQKLNLLPVLFDCASDPTPQQQSDWPAQFILDWLQQLETDRFEPALAILVSDVSGMPRDAVVARQCQLWKLSNAETALVGSILRSYPVLARAQEMPWPVVQRTLIDSSAPCALQLVAAMPPAAATGLLQTRPSDVQKALAFCREKLNLPIDQLNPQPLLNGHDLQTAGLRPGPAFKLLLSEARDAQLMGQLQNRSDALLWLAEKVPSSAGE